jgi:hypothetical protein
VRGHDWLVVTADGCVEVEEEVEEPPTLDVLLAVELAAVFVELAATAFVALFFASAGSLPEMSWMKIADQSAMKIAIATAVTRLRITVTRCRRACRRSAPSLFASDRSSERAAGGGPPASGSAWVEAVAGVIVTSGQGRNAMTTRSPR